MKEGLAKYMFKCKTTSPHGGISWKPTLQSGH